MSKPNLAALYLAHGEALELFLYGFVRCPHTAADLMQETFVKLAQQPAAANAEVNRPYIFRVAKNLAIDHHRKQARRNTFPTSLEVLDGTPDDTPSAQQTTEDRERLKALLQAMSVLPVRTQQVFCLNRVYGMTYVEVARHLDISESAVQKHLARAVAHAMAWAKSWNST